MGVAGLVGCPAGFCQVPARTAASRIGELVTRIDDIVLGLEDRRIAAMINGDTEALAALISPDCGYIHSSGDFDTGRA